MIKFTTPPINKSEYLSRWHQNWQIIFETFSKLSSLLFQVKENHERQREQSRKALMLAIIPDLRLKIVCTTSWCDWQIAEQNLQTRRRWRNYKNKYRESMIPQSPIDTTLLFQPQNCSCPTFNLINLGKFFRQINDVLRLSLFKSGIKVENE